MKPVAFPSRRRFLASLPLLGSAKGAQAPVPLFVGDTEPYAFADAHRQLTGAAYEQVQALAQALSVPLAPTLEPLIRAFKDVDHAAPALIIPPARLPSREGWLNWLVPLVPVRLMLFTKTDAAHDIGTLAAARDLDIGILSAPGLEETYRAAGLRRIQRLAHNETALRMLLSGHLDAILTADWSVYTLLRKTGNERSLLREGAVISSVHLWLAASRNFPQEQAQQWQAAAQGQQDLLARILERYR